MTIENTLFTEKQRELEIGLTYEKLGKSLLGDKWDSLTHYQKMCEIASIKAYYKNGFLSDIFGLNIY